MVTLKVCELVAKTRGQGLQNFGVQLPATPLRLLRGAVDLAKSSI